MSARTPDRPNDVSECVRPGVDRPDASDEESLEASGEAEGAGDGHGTDVRRLTDARTAVEFAHELYIDTTNLADALAGRSPARSLEVGCGYGRLTPWIATRSGEHHAIDPAASRLAVAAREFPDVRFHLARVEALPFSDDAFDLAVTWGVLNHVPKDAIDAAAAEMRRVVAPDGALIVSEATEGSPDPRWEYRSVDEWRGLLSPRELVECVETERDEEPFRDPQREHVVMTFR